MESVCGQIANPRPTSRRCACARALSYGDDDDVRVLFQLVLVPIVLSILIPIINNGGKFLALWLWLFMFIMAIVMMTIYPVLIAPLFNKVRY